MGTRKHVQRRKRRKGKILNLRLDGEKVKFDAEEYLIKDINKEENTLP